MDQKPWLTVAEAGSEFTIELGGPWTVDFSFDLKNLISQVPDIKDKAVKINAARIKALDSMGTWFIYKITKPLVHQKLSFSITGFSRDQKILLQKMSRYDVPHVARPIEESAIVRRLRALYSLHISVCSGYGRLLSFIGVVLERAFLTLLHPSRMRLTSLSVQLEKTGFNALFIVGMMTFLIGAVIVNQGAVQLRQFGAEIFAVDLLAVSMLREMAIILTAIMVAGRSGSAFTAEIGSMKVQEEVDAMQTMGLNPIDVLVLPRMMALIIAVPLLTFFADIMGLLGGALMAWNMLDISFAGFFSRLHEIITLNMVLVGLIKAPIFGAIIAINGCFEGLSVSGSSESVGVNTTRSVVQSIFIVIVLDAIFAVFFTAIDFV